MVELVPPGYSEFNPAIFAQNLSLRGVGVLTVLLMQPPGTPVTVARIQELGPREGREAIRTAMRELEAAGFLRRGQGKSWIWNGDPSEWITREGEPPRWQARHAV